jgi:hypothetical protein
VGILGSIFGNARLGIQISNQVIGTLLKDKELFIYPVVMAILSFFILVVFFVPFILLGGLAFGFVSLLVMLIIYYLVTTFMATYFLFAMYIAFTSFVQGKKIGMGAALSQAQAYLPLIIRWALFYTVLITVVKLLESQSRGLIGQIINFAVGIGLFLGTTFAVPIIFEDKIGPIDAVKKSAMFIINNIGKTFSGIIYFDIISFVIKIVGVLFIASALLMAILDAIHASVTLGGFTILGHTSLFAIVATGVIGIAIYVIGELFNYVTLHIYYLVVYEYVKNGKVPKGMDETLIRSSISHGGAPGPSTGSKPGAKGKGKGQSQPSNFGGLFQSGGGDAPDLKSFVK